MIAFAHPDDTWYGFSGTLTTAGTVTIGYVNGIQYTDAVRIGWYQAVPAEEPPQQPPRKGRRTELAHLLAAPPSPPRKAPRTRERRPAMSRPHQRG